MLASTTYWSQQVSVTWYQEDLTQQACFVLWEAWDGRIEILTGFEMYQMSDFIFPVNHSKGKFKLKLCCMEMNGVTVKMVSLNQLFFHYKEPKVLRNIIFLKSSFPIISCILYFIPKLLMLITVYC